MTGGADESSAEAAQCNVAHSAGSNINSLHLLLIHRLLRRHDRGAQSPKIRDDFIVNILETPDAVRQRNQELALADRQAVFRNDCASCHAAPLGGKTGAELFQLACLICHAPAHRATMVPDLMIAREPRNAGFWRQWIAEGKEKTLMPAFAQRLGGPMTDAQIESLVEFALAQLPTAPGANFRE